MARSALVLALVPLALLAARPASAQFTEGRVQLGLGTALFSYTSGSVEADDSGTEVDTSVIQWGIRNGVTSEVAYGITDTLVLGAFLTLGGISQTVEPMGAAEIESSEFQVAVGPKLDIVFSPGQEVRPFIGFAAGLASESSESGMIETSVLGFQLIGALGLRWFAADGFSLDPALQIGWGLASGETGPAAAPVDINASAFNVGLRLAVSGWI
jgi:hypothetical protein